MELSRVVILLGLFVAFARAIPPLGNYPPDFGSSDTDDKPHAFVRDRLPTNFIPYLYQLDIRPILDPNTGTGEQFTAPGSIYINGRVNGVTSTITVNSVDIQIDEASVYVKEQGTDNHLAIASQSADAPKEFYHVHLAQPLTNGANYTLYIEFISKVSVDRQYGLYRSEYRGANGQLRYLASTDFQAPDARYAFPCLDEPQFKAAWEISIIRLPPFTSLANTNLIGTQTNVPGLPGWNKDFYAPTLPMSTYLICFAVSDFISVSANATIYPRPVKVWGPPPLINRGQAAFSPDFSARVLKYLEDYYGIEYTFPKMDKISIPDYNSGAMENWGLNTYRDTRLLYEEGINTVQDMFSMTNTISHELVHNWWGNLVTCGWWEDLWVQEGAATYYAPVGVVGGGMAHLLPMETMITATVQRSLEFDANLLMTHPIHNVNVDPADVSVLFDTLTYHKGASLIRMMNAFVTEPIYNVAMTQFLNKFAYSNAHQNDLFAVLDEVIATNPGHSVPTGDNVRRIMDTWTLQPGYPLLSVERNEFTNDVTFTQSRYFANIKERDPANPDQSTWVIPISYWEQGESAINLRPKAWLNNTLSASIVRRINDQWFIVNPQTHGYYRVEYKNELLDRIIEQLWVNHTAFDVQIRSSLVDDNINLAFAGYLDLNKALNLTMYLKNERELFPFVSFVTNMALPYRMFSRAPGFPLFKKYVTGLMTDALTEINIEPQPNDPVPTTMLRTRLVEWQCNLGDVDCIDFAKRKFALWMTTPANTSLVFPDLQPSVYCTAVANGGDTEWEFIFSEYLKADRDVMQTNLLRALGCSKTSFRLNTLLDMALARDSGILNKHRTIAMQAVAGNSVGVDLAFKFIRDNYDVIVRRYGSGTVRSVITTLNTYYNDQVDKEYLESFIDSKTELTGVSLGTLERNMLWMEQHYVDFVTYIQQLP